ncbi:Protein NEN4 [Hirschfeldia incana]|nr:Protein NEN4 [Hirschfeldia incana]
MEIQTFPNEIVFFDLETNVPNKTGQHFHILEFGAIIVCPRKLEELESFTTLIQPKDLSVASLRSSRSDGITRAKVTDAPSFEDVAEKIYGLLNGRIWAGHNIRRFDCVRIKEAFAKVGKAAPEPSGIIDSLGLLSDKFGKRAGNMKMASLAAYFGLGVQKHRSLDDVRMNLEVLKHCATVLFLESTLPNQLEGKRQSSSKIMTRSRSHHQMTQKAMPYAKGNLGEMTQNVKNILSKAQGTQSLHSLIKHSHSLLR